MSKLLDKNNYRIGNKNYKILYIDNFDRENKGIISYDYQEIKVDTSFPIETQEETLIHEIVHGLFFESSLRNLIIEDKEEEFANRFSNILYKFLIDNEFIDKSNLIKENVNEIENKINVIMKNKIKQWAIDRKLHVASPINQMLKLTEEVGELAGAIAKQKNSDIADALGDIQVVLIVLSMQLGFDLDECLEQAYEVIKNRKGKMINGTFVKEEDY